MIFCSKNNNNLKKTSITQRPKYFYNKLQQQRLQFKQRQTNIPQRILVIVCSRKPFVEFQPTCQSGELHNSVYQGFQPHVKTTAHTTSNPVSIATILHNCAYLATTHTSKQITNNCAIILFMQSVGTSSYTAVLNKS